VVPVTAVRPSGTGEFVFVLQPDHTVKQRPVVRGQPFGERVQIASGLQAGETVITEGADRLRDGSRVILPGEKPPGPGAAGGRRGQRRNGGADGGAGAAGGAASAPGGAASEAPATNPFSGASAAQAPASGAAALGAGGGLSPEQRAARAAAWQKLTPEERAARRQGRRPAAAAAPATPN
jgi:multidrug efflux system membrane fusion protein